MWDLLSERRIGPWKAPLGLATGHRGRGQAHANPLRPLPDPHSPQPGGVDLCSRPSSPASWSLLAVTHVVDRRFGRRISSSRTGPEACPSSGTRTSPRVIERFNHGVLPDTSLVPVLIVAAAAGLWLAASGPSPLVAACWACSSAPRPASWCRPSPGSITWCGSCRPFCGSPSHRDRPRWGGPLAAGTAVLFWSAPIWWVPYKHTSDLHLNAWQLVAGNSFFLAMLLFVLGAAFLVVGRRSTEARIVGRALDWEETDRARPR